MCLAIYILLDNRRLYIFHYYFHFWTAQYCLWNYHLQEIKFMIICENNKCPFFTNYSLYFTIELKKDIEYIINLNDVLSEEFAFHYG